LNTLEGKEIDAFKPRVQYCSVDRGWNTEDGQDEWCGRDLYFERPTFGLGYLDRKTKKTRP